MGAQGIFGHMKLIQLNIWQGKLLAQILKFLDAEKPDIICLQEVFSSKQQIELPDSMFNSLEQIIAKLGYEYSFFSPTIGMDAFGSKVDYGNAVVSRYPLHNCRTIFTEGIYNPSTNTKNYFNNTRNLQLTQIDTPSGLLHLANHHGHWEKTPHGSAKSLEKMEVVAGEVQNLIDGALVVCGDMNLLAKSRAMQVFNPLLRNLTAENALPTTLSSLGKVTNVACDHMLVNEGVEVIAFCAADDLVSDHKALILEFEL
jgi:endonuclease/exonuclease/phosphatase family metal-dependent hydrolase